MPFKMNATTNFKFKPFKKGIVYKDNLIHGEVLKRWLERKLAKSIKEEISQEKNLTEEPKRGRGRPPKKDDNSLVQTNISSTEELPGNN
jgi:hypothetical protein